MTIVVDTSWVAALRDPADRHHTEAVAHHNAIGDEAVLIASITLAECLVGPAKLGVLDEAETALLSAFEIAVEDETAPRRWAACRASTGLKLPDAIVLETARRVGADAVATFDNRLAAACRDIGMRVFASRDE